MAKANESPETEPATGGSARATGSGGGGSQGGSGSGAGGSGGPQAIADLEFVKGLIDAVDASGIDSIEITRAGTRVKISKTPPSSAGAHYYALPGAAAPAAAPPNSGPPPAAPAAGPAPGASVAGGAAGSGGSAAAPSGAASEPASDADAGLIEVKSPMVGTFYRAPAPEAPPYVEVGTRIGKGQTLCILEAMKLMNELESEVEGVVRQVLVENAEPVEYGQVLFRIDPNG